MPDDARRNLLEEINGRYYGQPERAKAIEAAKRLKEALCGYVNLNKRASVTPAPGVAEEGPSTPRPPSTPAEACKAPAHEEATAP